jgi:hypothetical protein
MGVGKWSSANKRIVTGSTRGRNILFEDEWGDCQGTNKLFYAGVNSCFGFAIQLSDDTLTGAHFTLSADVAEFQALLDAINNQRAPRRIVGMFFVGALVYWTPANVKVPGYHWASMINSISYRFGFTHWLFEDVHYHDQGEKANMDYRLSVAPAVHAATLDRAEHVPGRDITSPQATPWRQVQMQRRKGPWFGRFRGT